MIRVRSLGASGSDHYSQRMRYAEAVWFPHLAAEASPLNRKALDR